MLRSLVPCKENQDILGFRISGTVFQSLSVEVGFWIPILTRIPDSTSKNFTNSGIRIPLHGAGTGAPNLERATSLHSCIFRTVFPRI